MRNQEFAFVEQVDMRLGNRHCEKYSSLSTTQVVRHERDIVLCLHRYAECESKFRYRYYTNNSLSFVVRRQNRELAGLASKPKERWNSGNRNVDDVS